MSAPPQVSPGGERIYAALAAYHEGEDQNGYLLLHLCEARARLSAKVQAAIRHDDIGSGRRRMHDPARCPDFHLERLRDLVGNDAQGLSETQLRQAIAERPHARRCTRPAAIAAVLTTLTPDATADDIELIEQDGTAYRITLVTRPSQTPDPAATYRAARAHKPLFARLIHEITDSPRWDDTTRTWDDVADTVTWDNATLGDLT